MPFHKVWFFIRYFNAVKICVNNFRGFFGFAYGRNGYARAFVCGVAHRKNALKVCPESCFVSRNSPFFRKLHAVEAVRIQFLAQRHYNRAYLKFFCCAFHGNRAPPAAFIRLAKLHFLQKHMLDASVVISRNLNRVCKVLKYDALFLGLFYFYILGGHFRPCPSVYAVYVFRAQAHGRAACVHGCVAAAYYRNVVSDDYFFI